MVGVINPNGTQTLAEQVKAAVKADYQVTPGEPVPNEASSASISTQTASLHSDPASVEEPSQTLSTGAIAGITVGGILFLVLCAGILFYFTRNWPRSERKASAEGQTTYWQFPQNIPCETQQQSVRSPVSPMGPSGYRSFSIAPTAQTLDELPPIELPPVELPVDQKRHSRPL